MEQNELQAPKIQLKAYSLKEVAVLYTISRRTLHTWLSPFKNEIYSCQAIQDRMELQNAQILFLLVLQNRTDRFFFQLYLLLIRATYLKLDGLLCKLMIAHRAFRVLL